MPTGDPVYIIHAEVGMPVNTFYYYSTVPQWTWVQPVEKPVTRRRISNLKGWELLEPLLNKEQVETLHQRNPYIEIIGTSGKVWTYWPRENYYSLRSNSGLYCLIPRGRITLCDRIIAMKLMLESDDGVVEAVAIMEYAWSGENDFLSTDEYYASRKGKNAAARIARRRAKEAVREEA